ncbi:MAG: HDOD domain-containing protein [Chromatiaceae bacterium]
MITHDPALTTNLLRLANSAFFGRPRQVTSVRQAVTFLGTKRVVEVALAAAFSGVLPEALPGYGIQAATFWRHCVAVAVLSERIADDRALSKDCDGFTCGLLHDIGKLVTSAYLARQTGEIMESIWGQRQVFIVAEHQILGADHAEIGAAVAEKWNLPEAVCAVVRWITPPAGGAKGGPRTARRTSSTWSTSRIAWPMPSASAPTSASFRVRSIQARSGESAHPCGGWSTSSGRRRLR